MTDYDEFAFGTARHDGAKCPMSATNRCTVKAMPVVVAYDDLAGTENWGTVDPDTARECWLAAIEWARADGRTEAADAAVEIAAELGWLDDEADEDEDDEEGRGGKPVEAPLPADD